MKYADAFSSGTNLIIKLCLLLLFAAIAVASLCWIHRSQIFLENTNR